MSIFHGLTEERIIPTGNGQQNRQRRFYCHVHGWYDLFVFPNAAHDHAKCGDVLQNAGAGASIPKTMAKAA